MHRFISSIGLDMAQLQDDSSKTVKRQCYCVVMMTEKDVGHNNFNGR